MKNRISDKLKYNGEVVLTYSIEYPQFKSRFFRPAIAAVNKFYKDKALAYKKHCETELFNLAVEQYKESIANDYPMRVFEAMMVYKLTYLASCIISIYFDTYEYTGGAHGNTIRDAQTWNLSKNRMVQLNRLIQCDPDYKTYILESVFEQIEKEPDIYFDNYEELAEEMFDENNFYCTPNSIVFFYQQYDIAPYSSGIREFTIPYSDCILNPIKLCSMK